MSGAPGLTRRTESLLRALRTRHGRRDSEHCFCDGLRASREVVTLAPDLVELVILRDEVSLPFPSPVEPVVLPAAEFDRIAPTVHSQGILVLSRRPAPVPMDAPMADPFALVLDRVGDPGNFGTILRTARAVGLHEVWLTRGTADPFSDKVVRSASGAQFALKIRHGGDLPELAADLRKLGVTTCYRTLPASGGNVFLEPNLFDHSAIILGCEATGVAELENSRGLNIPMPGDAESLNVAQAATVILFEYVRRMF